MILYQIDNVSDLKIADRWSRILRNVTIVASEMVSLFILLQIIGLWAIIGFTIAVFFFFPLPYIIVPSGYSITEKEITSNDGKHFRFKKRYQLQMNKRKHYVSISEVNKEFLRIYTPDPEKVFQILSQSLYKL